MASHVPADSVTDQTPRLFRYGLTAYAVAISLAHVWANSIGNVAVLTQNAWHFAAFLLLGALTLPATTSASGLGKTIRFMDIVFALLVSSSAVYLSLAEDAIYDRGVRLNWLDRAAIVCCILGALEYTRRLTGWIIPVLIILSLSYISWWGALIEGVFRFAGLSLETLMFRSVYGDDALFGNIATISSTFVFMFILFGAFLIRSGAGEFIVDVSRSIAGRFVGGPGFVAVLASALTGTISGSAVANTASTGVITIPLMKRAGFPNHFAGGVEAAASTGGQLMPPIMGAGAFVMASLTLIPYTWIVVVSIVPAILYFATVACFIRIEAKRTNANALAGEDAPPFWQVFRKGGPPFFAPVGLLIGLLVSGYTPTYAAGFAIVTCIVASWFTPNKMGLKAIISALELGARSMILTAVLLCSVGLIVNVITTAGIGNTFSLMISSWADGSLIIAIVLVALASLVLGMGLPVTASYIVLGTLSAPALNQLILQSELVDIIASGQLPETARAIFMISAPSALESLGAPMAVAEAKALVGALPMETLALLSQQAFSPAVLTTALLSAHMIVYWLSQDSNVTPPVALAAFTAAAIAEAKPMTTAFSAWKVAKGLYLVPLLFAYTPLLSGDWPAVLEIGFFALFGMWALAAGLAGYWEKPLGWLMRLLVLAVGTALLWPLGLTYHAPLLLVMGGLLWLNLRQQDQPETLSRPA